MSYGTVQAEKVTTESGYSLGAGNASSFKNRIINGSFGISQYNSTSSVSLQTSTGYTIDRWYFNITQNSKLTTQQDQNSVTPPAGFTHYLGVTTSSAITVGAGDSFEITQPIEGNNVSDLAWGSASAKPVVLSFWVRSSLTGTFSGTLQNSNNTRSYVYTYTINSANTWEQKTIAVTGCTDGTWLTTNGIGLKVRFDLGDGSGLQTSTTGSWTTSDYRSATGSVALVANASATWYVTGVQLEVGTVATSFDFRSYGTELMLCQRYYWYQSAYPTSYAHFGPGYSTSSSNAQALLRWNVTMRTQPTITTTAASTFLLDGAGSFNPSALSISFITDSTARVSATSSGLTTGQPYNLASQGAGAAAIYYSAEL